MLINQSQANLLHTLLDEIETQLGIKLGYSSVWGSFVSDNDDFVIYEEGYFHEREGYPDAEITSIHLVHRQDFEQNGFILVQENPSQFPLHDQECENFWKKLHFALEYGDIKRNPKHSKDFGNITIKVIKMANERFDILIKTPGHSLGMMVTLEEFQEDTLHLDYKEEVLETIAELEQLIRLEDA